MSLTAVDLNLGLVKAQIDKSTQSGLPLLVCLIATKACYIKFSGLVRALVSADHPFITLASGQHYEPLLTHGADELNYREHVHGSMQMDGNGLALRSSKLFDALNELYVKLNTLGAKSCLLAVCGDTLTAGVGPYAWYMITGQRSIHVEAGLRSMAPKWEWIKHADFIHQRFVPWMSSPLRPFPEGLCTRIATIASQHLFAPVSRNFDTLIDEGYPSYSITISGSPSVDAVDYAEESIRLNERVSNGNKRLRVDIHRRENLTFDRLSAIFDGLKRISSDGIPIEFVLTKSMQNCKGASWQQVDLDQLVAAGVTISLQTASYIDVIRYLKSNTVALYTDSGGLQEESTILGIPCMTCRYETDRPETVLDFQTNVLIPPISGVYIRDCVIKSLSSDRKSVWPGLGMHAHSYGVTVGKNIVNRLRSMTAEEVTEVVLK